MLSNKTKIHGWFNFDKPEGISSAKAVAIIRKKLNCSKIGHGGTLDPLASGVLPIAIGEATKTVSYVMDSAKKYEFSISWGYETTTDDKEGSPTRTSNKIPTKEDIDRCIPEFIGTIKQIPPDYSAVKIDGKRAYSLARFSEKRGIENQVDLKSRDVNIHNLSLLSLSNNKACFSIFCGKGTYVRSLGRDLGRRLGSAGHISDLKRISVGNFKLKDAISLDFFKNLRDIADAKKNVISLSTVLDDIPALHITPEEAQRIRMGQRIPYFGKSYVESQNSVAICDGIVIALITLDSGIIRPVRVFNIQK